MDWVHLVPSSCKVLKSSACFVKLVSEKSFWLGRIPIILGLLYEILASKEYRITSI